MSIALALPDERLIGLVDSYGFYALPLKEERTIATGLVAFNISNTSITVDGYRRAERILMGLPQDPVFIRYETGSGPIMTMRLSYGTYDRALGIDLTREEGVVGISPDRHKILAGIGEKLQKAPHEPLAQFAALDRAMLGLLPDVKPPGLAERFLHYCMSNDGDITITAAAEILGCSTRSLERACRNRLGRTPKRIARGVRVARTFFRSRDEDIRPELMADFPFADLPHFLNEMRRITGMNRRDHIAQASSETALPYRYFWPDGSEAIEADDRERWFRERQRRMSFIPK